MALHDLGYRKWQGKLAPGGMRWAVISGAAIRAAWKSQWIRRLLFLAFVPAFWYGLAFFFVEQATQYPAWQRAALDMLRTMDLPGHLRHIDLHQNPDAARHQIWSFLLNSYIRNPQAVVMVLLIGLIAPPLISQDLRSRAFLLYFSRPLTRGEYLLGKSAAVWAYLLLISAVPALLLYLMGVLLSPRIEVVASTWDLPFRIVLASCILAIPTTSLALMFSSLTQESRYAAFAWFLVWILGWLTFSIMQSVEMGVQQAATQPDLHPRWSLVSPFHVLGRVQQWAFGFTSFEEILVPGGILLTVTGISLAILYHRISAPMRM